MGSTHTHFQHRLILDLEKTMTGILNRYLFKKFVLAMIVIIGVTIALVLFFDILYYLENYIKAPISDGHSRTWLIIQTYLLRIPIIITSVMPYCVMGAALVTCAPMLHKNEFTALGSSGISPQTICRCLFYCAFVCGIMQYSISNHLNPQLHNHYNHLQTALGRISSSSRSWKADDNKSIWFAARSSVYNEQTPTFDRVYIIAASGDIVYAQSMSWKVDRWAVHPPIIHWRNQDTQTQTVSELQSFSLSGDYALNYTPFELQQKLLTREALNGIELFNSGQQMHLSLFLNRCLHIFAPLLALAYGLPYFVRFQNRQRLIVASAQALALSTIPICIIAFTGMAADASSWSPWLSNACGLLLAAIPGIWMYKRWYY